MSRSYLPQIFKFIKYSAAPSGKDICKPNHSLFVLALQWSHFLLLPGGLRDCTTVARLRRTSEGEHKKVSCNRKATTASLPARVCCVYIERDFLTLLLRTVPASDPANGGVVLESHLNYCQHALPPPENAVRRELGLEGESSLGSMICTEKTAEELSSSTVSCSHHKNPFYHSAAYQEIWIRPRKVK